MIWCCGNLPEWSALQLSPASANTWWWWWWWWRWWWCCDSWQSLVFRCLCILQFLLPWQRYAGQKQLHLLSQNVYNMLTVALCSCHQIHHAAGNGARVCWQWLCVHAIRFTMQRAMGQGLSPLVSKVFFGDLWGPALTCCGCGKIDLLYETWECDYSLVLWISVAFSTVQQAFALGDNNRIISIYWWHLCFVHINTWVTFIKYNKWHSTADSDGDCVIKIVCVNYDIQLLSPVTYCTNIDGWCGEYKAIWTCGMSWLVPYLMVQTTRVKL